MRLGESLVQVASITFSASAAISMYGKFSGSNWSSLWKEIQWGNPYILFSMFLFPNSDVIVIIHNLWYKLSFSRFYLQEVAPCQVNCSSADCTVLFNTLNLEIYVKHTQISFIFSLMLFIQEQFLLSSSLSLNAENVRL